MKVAFDKRLFVVLLLLSAVTLSQLSAGALDDQNSHALVACGVVLVALLKVRIIIREFMEVRHAPALLCRVTDLWVVLTAVCLIGGYFVGAALSQRHTDSRLRAPGSSVGVSTF